MSALKFSGPVLPDGESRDVYVVDGRVSFEPQPDAETAARGWLVPGLVDAHNHLGLEDHGAITDDEILVQAHCCCATADRPATPAGSRSAWTCRGWCGAGVTSRAPAATSATSASRSSRTSS